MKTKRENKKMWETPKVNGLSVKKFTLNGDFYTPNEGQYDGSPSIKPGTS